MGAWIETSDFNINTVTNTVAPRVGAWIETLFVTNDMKGWYRRTPCGCVD